MSNYHLKSKELKEKRDRDYEQAYFDAITSHFPDPIEYSRIAKSINNNYRYERERLAKLVQEDVMNDNDKHETPICLKCKKPMKEQDKLDLMVTYPQIKWICPDCGIGTMKK